MYDSVVTSKHAIPLFTDMELALSRSKLPENEKEMTDIIAHALLQTDMKSIFCC